jgi:hypothetical protein
MEWRSEGWSSGEWPIRRGRDEGPAGAPAAAVVGAWRPCGGCPLPRSSTGAGSRAGGEASRDAGAGAACASGPEVERATH